MPLDYEIILQAPDGTRYDVTERAVLGGLGTISSAIERNLHEFRASDLNLQLDDADGFVSGLFDMLTKTDRWRVYVSRDGLRRFSGIVLPIDNIKIDKREFLVDLSAMDLSKALEDIDASTVARTVTAYALNATATAGATTLTLVSTANLYNGDQLQLTEGFNQETVDVGSIASTTSVVLKATIAATYTTAAAVKLLTPFYRFQTAPFLSGRFWTRRDPS